MDRVYFFSVQADLMYFNAIGARVFRIKQLEGGDEQISSIAMKSPNLETLDHEFPKFRLNRTPNFTGLGSEMTYLGPMSLLLCKASVAATAAADQRAAAAVA
jgi:hypothetical protein